MLVKPLLFLLVFVVGFSLASALRAYNSGTGFFSSFIQPGTINVVSEEDRDTRTNVTIVPRPPGTVTVPRVPVRQIAPIRLGGSSTDPQPPAPAAPATTIQTNGATCYQDCIKRPGKTSAMCGSECATATTNNPPAGGVNQGGAANQPVSNSITTCGGGNIPVRVGQTVSTGKLFGTDGRECVTCSDKGTYVNSRACAVAVAEDPKNTILPVGAGYQYTGGSKEKPVVVPNPCINSVNGNVRNTASGVANDKGEFCFNGAWKKEAEVVALGNTFCASVDSTKPNWNNTTARCEAATTLKEPELPIKENEETAKCGPYFKYNEATKNCDAAVSADRFAEGIEQQEEICIKDVNRKYDKETGLCIPKDQPLTVRKPIECKEELSNNNKTKTECPKDSKGVVTSAKHSYCSTGFDPKTLLCRVAVPIAAVTTLTNNQKLELKNTTQQWSINNPMLVDKPADCPPGSTVNDTGKGAWTETAKDTIQCTPPKPITQQQRPVAQTSTQVDYLNKYEDILKNDKNAFKDGSSFGLLTTELDCKEKGLDCVRVKNGLAYSYLDKKIIDAKFSELQKVDPYLRKYQEIISNNKDAFDDGTSMGLLTTEIDCKEKKLDCVKVNDRLFYAYLDKKVIDDKFSKIKAEDGRTVSNCNACNTSSEICRPGYLGEKPRCVPKVVKDDSEVGPILINPNGQVGGLVTGGPSQCKYDGGDYYNGNFLCPDENGNTRIPGILDSSGNIDYKTKYEEILRKDNKAFDDGPTYYGHLTTKADCEDKGLDCVKVENGFFYNYIDKNILDTKFNELNIPSQVSVPDPNQQSSRLKQQGQPCSSNNSCVSKDCRNIAKTPHVDGEWICMAGNSSNSRPISETDSVDENGKKYNGYYCTTPGNNNACKSGYCADNRAGFWNTCEDNPFTTQSSSTTQLGDIVRTQEEEEDYVNSDTEAFPVTGDCTPEQVAVNPVKKCILQNGVPSYQIN